MTILKKNNHEIEVLEVISSEPVLIINPPETANYRSTYLAMGARTIRLRNETTYLTEPLVFKLTFKNDCFIYSNDGNISAGDFVRYDININDYRKTSIEKLEKLGYVPTNSSKLTRISISTEGIQCPSNMK